MIHFVFRRTQFRPGLVFQALDLSLPGFFLFAMLRFLVIQALAFNGQPLRHHLFALLGRGGRLLSAAPGLGRRRPLLHLHQDVRQRNPIRLFARRQLRGQ